jgi:RNA polymerase sigma-70 factor, ECF subfamily
MTSVVDPPVSATAALGAHGDVPRGLAGHSADSDDALVEHIRAGTRAAEAELYRRYARPIADAVLCLLGSHQETQDVLQDTFVDAFEQIGGLRETSSLRSWLFGIAIHKVQRRFRRRKLLDTLGFSSPPRDAKLDALAIGYGPEARAELALLDRSLQSLSAQERIAWMLRRIEGYTLEEVAQACRCSLATAKRRVVAADETVRAHFDGEMPHE